MSASDKMDGSTVRLLLVVAVALVDEDNRILIAQRPEERILPVFGSFLAESWKSGSGLRKRLFGNWKKSLAL